MTGEEANDQDQEPLARTTMADEDEPGARDHLRRSGEAAKEAAKSGWEALRGGGKVVEGKSKDVIDSSRESIDRGYRTVTLRSYRDELDEALAEIVDVLAAQDAEIRHLRARVEQLEGQSAATERE